MRHFYLSLLTGDTVATAFAKGSKCVEYTKFAVSDTRKLGRYVLLPPGILPMMHMDTAMVLIGYINGDIL
jgi:hypothetical protein